LDCALRAQKLLCVVHGCHLLFERYQTSRFKISQWSPSISLESTRSIIYSRSRAITLLEVNSKEVRDEDRNCSFSFSDWVKRRGLGRSATDLLGFNRWRGMSLNVRLPLPILLNVLLLSLPSFPGLVLVPDPLH